MAWTNWPLEREPPDAFRIAVADAVRRHVKWAKGNPNEMFANVSGRQHLASKEAAELFKDYVCLSIYGVRDPEEIPTTQVDVPQDAVEGALRRFDTSGPVEKR